MRSAVVRALTTKLTAQPKLRAAEDPDARLADFPYWRRVGGSTARRDQADSTRAESIRRAFDFADYHPIATRYVSLMREWVVSGEYRVLSDNEKVQAAIDSFMFDPRNAWDELLPKYVFVRVVAGELFLPSKVDPITGRVVLDYWDPADVTGVLLDEGSQRIVKSVVYAVPGERVEPLTVPVVRPVQSGPNFGMLAALDPRDAESHELTRGVTGVLCWQWNAPPNATRGRSDFLASMDPLSTLDDFHAAEAERAQLLARILGSVRVQGDAEAVSAMETALAQREPWYASLPVHNEEVEFQFGAPSTGAADSDQRERTLRRYACAPMGIPQHILTSDVEAGGTRAVATAANDPAWLHGKRVQQDLVSVIERCVQYQLDTFRLLGKLNVPVEEAAFRIETPALLRPDPLQAAPVLAQVTGALLQARSERLIDEATARRTFLQMLAEVGVKDIDIDEVELALGAEPATSPESREAFDEAQRELNEE